MRLDRVFWSHFSPNLGPGGWVTSVLLVHLGLDLRSGLLASNLLGATPVALAAVMGPRTGLPQMEASRRVLGRAGLRLSAFLNWIYCIGWDAVNNVPAATAWSPCWRWAASARRSSSRSACWRSRRWSPASGGTT